MYENPLIRQTHIGTVDLEVRLKLVLEQPSPFIDSGSAEAYSRLVMLNSEKLLPQSRPTAYCRLGKSWQDGIKQDRGSYSGRRRLSNR